MRTFNSPTLAPQLLQMIIELSLMSKNLPTTEKQATITPLPKKGAFLQEMNNIRPIAVGSPIGRTIGKLLAGRLGTILIENNMLDHAQNAFLPGRDIHNPISIVKECYKQSLNAPNGTSKRPLYAIFYDISKAYDTVQWSSITMAMRDIGLTEDFISFVHNSLQGTSIRMKTSINGKATEYITMNQAVRQGDPLAPLLFDIVMDALHRGYKKLGGYKLHNGPRVSSVGYCDDTVILASTLQELKAMNACTCKFFTHQGFNLSATKTYVTGRHRDGSQLDPDDEVRWPQTQTALPTKAHNESIRHLGLWINMNLDWKFQTGVMNGYVQEVAAAIRTGKSTFLQGAMLARDSLPQRLEIGMRHAQISNKQLKLWDTAITRAFSFNAGVGHGSIYKGALTTLLRTHTMEDHYIIAKATQIITGLTKNNTTLTNFSRTTFDNTSDDTEECPAGDPELIRDLTLLHTNGITITPNKSSCITPTPPTDEMPSTSLPFGDFDIPVALRGTDKELTLKLWGKDYASPHKATATLATDGSKLENGSVGASIVFMHNQQTNREYNPHSHYWTIPTDDRPDSYIAEMAAINKALRSIPVTVNLTIHTDSLSSIQAIHSFRESGSQDPMISCHARPYLRAVAEALHGRSRAGATTRIEHVTPTLENATPHPLETK